MSKAEPVIRALLAPLATEHLLIPSNVVAEIIDYATPMPYEQGPGWLLGELEWNGWQVPVISYAVLAGAVKRDPASSGSRILIIKTLAEEGSLYYIGILMKGLPKLEKVLPDSLELLEEKTTSPTLFCRVKLGDRTAMIPELDELSSQVAEAIYDQ
jgi:chemosensory pili system protein ChpC